VGGVDNSVTGLKSPWTIRHAHSPYTAPKRQRRYGHGFAETVTETETVERKRNAGNRKRRECVPVSCRAEQLKCPIHFRFRHTSLWITWLSRHSTYISSPLRVMRMRRSSADTSPQPNT